MTPTPTDLLAAICDELNCHHERQPLCASDGDCVCQRLADRIGAQLRQETPT